jgi:hypothetical protein
MQAFAGNSDMQHWEERPEFAAGEVPTRHKGLTAGGCFIACHNRAEAQYTNAATQQEAERAERAIKAAAAALKASGTTAA